MSNESLFVRIERLSTVGNRVVVANRHDHHETAKLVQDRGAVRTMYPGPSTYAEPPSRPSL